MSTGVLRLKDYSRSTRNMNKCALILNTNLLTASKLRCENGITPGKSSERKDRK